MKNNKIQKKPNYLPLKFLFTVFTICINIFMVFIAFGITRYSGLGKKQFLIVNVAILIILLALDIYILFVLRSRRKYMLLVSTVCTFVFGLVAGYAFYAVIRVNTSIGKITNSTAQTENVEASIIVYDENQNFIASAINGLEQKKVGYANGTQQYEIVRNEMKAENINPQYQPYQEYTSMLIDLFSKKIDAAIVPSNYVASLFNVEDSFKEYLDGTKEIAKYDKTVSIKADISSDKDLTKEPFTVLLIGTADGLSDSMMLCSVNPISLKVTISSIARDSYVPISCYNNASNKLNSARAVSRECLINTIENLVGVDIDYYVETNFQGVVQMVDALDGIVVNNPYEFVGQNSSSERGKFTVWVPAGENAVLNGEQALAFARERHLYATGDFQRQVNQQQVIQSILRKIMRTRDLNVALNVLSAAGDNIQTNFTLDQLTGFFNYVLKKATRYYNSEHVENIFEIAGSRITGYSSGLWDDNLGLSLYIYRLFQGSISDTKTAIQRNLLKITDVTSEKFVHWKAASEYYPPKISSESYAEKVLAPEVPETIANYSGKAIGKLTSWAKSFNIVVNIEYIAPNTDGYDANVPEGTVISQDVAAGTAAKNISAVNVRVITHVEKNPSSTPTPTPTPTATTTVDIGSKEGCKALNKYWHDNSCHDNEKSATPLPDKNTQAGCIALNKYWYDNSCHDNEKPVPNENSQDGCSALGKYWYDGSCHAQPQPTQPVLPPTCPEGQELDPTTQTCKVKEQVPPSPAPPVESPSVEEGNGIPQTSSETNGEG